MSQNLNFLNKGGFKNKKMWLYISIFIESLLNVLIFPLRAKVRKWSWELWLCGKRTESVLILSTITWFRSLNHPLFDLWVWSEWSLVEEQETGSEWEEVRWWWTHLLWALDSMSSLLSWGRQSRERTTGRKTTTRTQSYWVTATDGESRGGAAGQRGCRAAATTDAGRPHILSSQPGTHWYLQPWMD